MKKRVIFLIIIFALLIIVLFFSFGFSRKCSSKECFNDAMIGCKKVVYTDDSENVTWRYSIYGENSVLSIFRKKESCEINVKLLQVKAGDAELEKGQGLSMDCEIPYGVVASPQADISKCHGLLREFLQEQIIQRLHKYIVSNVGQIDEELGRVV